MGYSVYRAGGKCVSSVWLEGRVWRHDSWADCRTAARYVLGRAEQHSMSYHRRDLDRARRKASEKYGA